MSREDQDRLRLVQEFNENFNKIAKPQNAEQSYDENKLDIAAVLWKSCMSTITPLYYYF